MTFTERKAGDAGHLDDTNMLLRDHETAVYMPPAGTPQENADNFSAALSKATVNGVGGTIRFQPETYRFPDTVVVRDVFGLRLMGAGMRTQIVSTFSDATKPVLLFAHARHCHVEGLEIASEGAAYAAIQLRRDDLTNANIVPTFNHFVDLFLDCRDRIINGIVLGGAGATDANNDFNSFEQVEMANYKTNGFLFQHASQSYNNVARNCKLNGGTNAQYAVDARGDFCGSLLWYGGFVYNNQAADFGLGGWYQPWLIEGVNSEGSKRFITMNSSVRANAIVRACRYAANAIHDDLTAIIVDGARHQFTLENCEIGDSSGDKALQLRFQNNAVVKMEMNVVYSSAASVFSHQVPGQLYGNQQCTNEGAQTRVPLTGEAITPSAAIVDAAP